MWKFVSLKISEDKEIIKVLVSENMNEIEYKDLKNTLARLAGANIYCDLHLTSRNGDVLLPFYALYYALDEHQPLNLAFRPSGASNNLF